MWKCLAVGWIVGVACIGRMQLWWMPQFSGLWIGILLLLFALIYQNYRPSFVLKSLILMVCLGLGYITGFLYADHQLKQRLLQRQLHAEVVHGIVYLKKLNELTENGIQQPVDWLLPDGTAKQGILFLNAEQVKRYPLELGQYYEISGEMSPVHAFAVAGVFDQEQWYLQQNLMFRLKVNALHERSKQEIQQQFGQIYLQQQATWFAQLWLWVERQRLTLRQFIEQQPLQHKGLLLGLLTGDQSFLSEETVQQFRTMGMSHLLAISGPHVLIFAILVCWLLQCLIQRFYANWYLKVPRQYLMIIPFLICVMLYCIFVGLEIPALRTLLMCIALAGCTVLSVAFRPLSLLLATATLLLYFDPFSVLSAAFWLSYGACFILLRIYQTMNKIPVNVAGKEKYGLILVGLVESQWKIFVALFPLMVIFFQQVAWITPLTNIIAIPWLGLVVVPLDILAACSFFIFQPLAEILFYLNDHLLSTLLVMLDMIEALFHPHLIPIALNQLSLMCVMLAILIMFSPQGLLPRTWSMLAVFPLFGVGLVMAPTQIAILDVAQGQALFVQDQDKQMMIDVGGKRNEQKFGIGQQVIIPFLLGQGIKKVDDVILTHLDQDHSGALDSIIKTIDIQNIYANEMRSVPNKTTFDYCAMGQQWQWSPNIEIHILSPRNIQSKRSEQERNEQSCVVYLKLKYGQPYRHFLVMGDAGWETEYQLLKYYPDLKVDVLVLGHHGSKYSSSYAFLAHYRPQIAIASAGYANRYQHPHTLTQARLQALKIPLYTTIDVGSIHFILKQGHVEMQTQRAQRLWLDRKTSVDLESIETCSAHC